jgi:hypothetical protein
MRPQAPDALAAGQGGSRLVPIVERQLSGEVAYSQSRPLPDTGERQLSAEPKTSCYGTALSKVMLSELRPRTARQPDRAGSDLDRGGSPSR